GPDASPLGRGGAAPPVGADLGGAPSLRRDGPLPPSADLVAAPAGAVARRDRRLAHAFRSFARRRPRAAPLAAGSRDPRARRASPPPRPGGRPSPRDGDGLRRRPIRMHGEHDERRTTFHTRANGGDRAARQRVGG